MVGWLRKLLGGASHDRSPRDVLMAAMTDFATPALAAKALSFYDNPREFEAFLANLGREAPWSEEGRIPTPPELAFEIYFTLLSENSFLGNIDWAAGGEDILAEFDRLFSSAGLIPFTEAECDEATRICSTHEGRGEAFPSLIRHLEVAARNRGRTVVYFGMGQDANFPLLLKPECYKQWRFAKFGTGFRVLP
jgi:hypothetical protein